MKKFEEFLNTRDLRRTTKDAGLAKSLVKDAEQRFEVIMEMKLTEKSSTLIFEQVYESLRECIDALLSLQGYKSYSHVASIAFLQNHPEFSTADINELDNAREKRNLAKYYGKQISILDTKDVIELHNQLKPKLNALFNQMSK